jgi:glucosamine--fructose-6-phosphate aminotransferase (isomerizing)
LKTSLEEQVERAPAFIDESWPAVKDQALDTLHEWERTFEDVFICGCGDSHHAAVNLEMAFTVWTGRRVRALRSSQAVYDLAPYLMRKGDQALVIGISASGEVARTREALFHARQRGARTLALTGDSDSTLASIAEATLTLPTPVMPFGPGLVNYLASLMMGYAVAWTWALPERSDSLDRRMQEIPLLLEAWSAVEREKGIQFAEYGPDRPSVFLGSGPLFGSALFAAAKQIEAAGVLAWGQDVEEWAHIEYFCEPADMPTWLLQAGGISSVRAREVVSAAEAIGRRVQVSTWFSDSTWPSVMRGALSPMVLWVGPVVSASRRAMLLGEESFRGFGGGRSRVEGGGASRIRSSEMLEPEEIEAYFSWDSGSN